MPPSLALVLTLLFVAFLFRRELRQPYQPSWAIWIPCVWLLIIGSRSIGQWLNLGAPDDASHIEDGSPIDRAIYFLLILVGFFALSRRQISWSQVFRNNIALTIFFLYCGFSVLWSDLPFLAFKRWTKGLGDPIMALIILTEQEPLKATERVIKTCAYILIPFSVLLIKYYPHLGRSYAEWEGTAFYTGVTTNKNMLGFVLMVCGLFLFAGLIAKWSTRGKNFNRVDDFGIPIVLLCMVWWLFQIADSKTSLIVFLFAVGIFVILGRQSVRSQFGVYLIVGIILAVVLEFGFNIKDLLITSAGRDATLSGRTDLWNDVLSMDPKPIFGHGFESFWIGERLSALHARWYYKPTMAHNGYIEIYLTLGWLGILFVAGVLVSSYASLRRKLLASSELKDTLMFGRLGMAFLFAFLPYNYTEAAIRSLHFLFVIFLVFTIKAPNPRIDGERAFPFTSGRGVHRVGGVRS